MSETPFPPTEPQQLQDAAPLERPRSGLAITALVLGILGLVFCPLVGIVGLILGIIATVRAGREPQRYGGKGMAIGGICTGAAGLLFVPMLLAILLPSLSRAREITKRAVDASNLRGIGMAIIVYASDHGDQFPPDLQTLVADGSVSPKQFIDPSSGNAPPRCDYYYVTGLAVKDPAGWIVAYSDPAYHNGEGANVLYLDSSVRFVMEKPSGQFTRELDDFKADYTKKRGQPPVIIPPQ